MRDLSEDTLGFGVVELRTARDLLIRPASVLAAWMEGGPTGHGRYTRPLRLYMALNAVLMLLLFFRGGSGYMMDTLPPDVVSRAVEDSGQSRDAILSRVDGWATLIMVPLLSLIYVLAVAPLLSWWDRRIESWRDGFRAGFAYLNAWTVPMLPIAWFSYGNGPAALVSGLVIMVLGLVIFMRMGRGRWYDGFLPGFGKALALMVAFSVAAAIGGPLVVAISLFAGARA